ncbi:MAG TPA: iron ABC transporter, partial [Flavobacteriaceae bacterium]|nr:iron ABC transporter [Flavobacteriaceae bacterium]
MPGRQKHTFYFWLLGTALLIALFFNVSMGSVHIPFKEVIGAI